MLCGHSQTRTEQPTCTFPDEAEQVILHFLVSALTQRRTEDGGGGEQPVSGNKFQLQGRLMEFETQL